MRAGVPWVAILASTALLGATSSTHAGDGRATAWQRWRVVPGVVDIAGPRGDGRFVVAAGGKLFLLRPADGRLSRYPASGPAYATKASLEPYLVVAGPRQRVSAAGCAFPRDSVYAIDPASRSVLSVSPAGRVRLLARVPDVKRLTGIEFDTAGHFGGRLLVVGLSSDDHGVLVSVDCRGRRHVLTRSAPQLEGGLAIAPPGFGVFAGDLIAADELDGRLLALAPGGRVSDVVDPGQPAGPDIGVESIGVVPVGLAAAYLADRRVPGNRNPGHDSILSLGAGALRAAGVAPGDLLVALEGGGSTIAVRCAARCRVRAVAVAPAGAHAEGSISFAR